ncbi:hypothetical protein [Zooshikella sp. RANM57]|uniref:hypothetical protein n=1 Tax=Zooshikella sp. RANM57 TaxID=3425863 RepID=UPI003D6E0BF0
MISPNEITDITHNVLFFGISLFFGMASFGVWFSRRKEITFLVQVVERFLFHISLYFLVSGGIMLVRAYYLDNRFHLGWDGVGFTVVGIIFIYQWAYSSVAKERRICS